MASINPTTSPRKLLLFYSGDNKIEQRIAYAEALTMGKTIFEWSGRGAAVTDIQALTHELLDVLNEQDIRTSSEAEAVNG